MEHHREIKNVLEWHNEGKFNATITNGVITELHFCEPGQDKNSSGKCLVSTDFKYLKSVYEALGEMFEFIEKEGRRQGYSYADEKEIAA